MIPRPQATSVSDPAEEYDLFPQSPGIDATLCEVSEHTKLASHVRCTDGFMQSETVVGTSSMSRVLSVMVIVEVG